MKKVKWIVECETLVNTDDDDVAKDNVHDLFENKLWDYTGLCVQTYEDMKVTEVNDA